MAFPEGQYTKVRVVAIQGGSGALTDGTGTANATKGFSCGTFAAGDQPVIGEFYNITATSKNGKPEFNVPYKCVNSGPTSDFQE